MTHDAINGTDKVNIDNVYNINMRQAKHDFTREDCYGKGLGSDRGMKNLPSQD